MTLAISEYKPELLVLLGTRFTGQSIENRGALRTEKWLATVRQWHTTNCLAFRQESKGRFIARQCKGTREGLYLHRTASQSTSLRPRISIFNVCEYSIGVIQIFGDVKQTPPWKKHELTRAPYFREQFRTRKNRIGDSESARAFRIS